MGSLVQAQQGEPEKALRKQCFFAPPVGLANNTPSPRLRGLWAMAHAPSASSRSLRSERSSLGSSPSVVSFLVLSFPRCTRTLHPARPKGANRGELCDRVANSRRKAKALSLVAWFDVPRSTFCFAFFPPLSSHQRHSRATDGDDRREALTANFSFSLAKCGVLNTARKI